MSVVHIEPETSIASRIEVVFDGTATGPEIGDALADVTHVVLSAAPGDSGPADATLTRLTAAPAAAPG